METHLLKIDGMGGKHCVMAIEKVVEIIDGALIRHISVGQVIMEIDNRKTSKNAVIIAIERMGYRVQ